MSNLDETELARLEALALPYARLQPSRYEDTQNICTRAVPALVAEVRRLREDRTAMLRDMDAAKTKDEPCDDCWTIYMLMREMGIEEKNWFHRDVCARLKAMQNAEEENAALREKVEAWEWLFEVEQLYSHETLWRFYQKECALDELLITLTAAFGAVHADRE